MGLADGRQPIFNEDQLRKESLSNVKQYVAFLYLARTPGLDFEKEDGRKLAECIRLYPRRRR